MMLGWGWVTSCQTLQLGPWDGSSWSVVGDFWPAVKVFHEAINSTCCTLASARGVAAVNLHI